MLFQLPRIDFGKIILCELDTRIDTVHLYLLILFGGVHLGSWVSALNAASDARNLTGDGIKLRVEL